MNRRNGSYLCGVARSSLGRNTSGTKERHPEPKDKLTTSPRRSWAESQNRLEMDIANYLAKWKCWLLLLSLLL
jgi:hypothetical protein